MTRRDGGAITALTLSCRKMGKLLSGSVKSFSWKSLNTLFQETKSKYFDISFWNDIFPFDRNLYLAEKKNMQSISVGNQSSIKKCCTSVLEKKYYYTSFHWHAWSNTGYYFCLWRKVLNIFKVKLNWKSYFSYLLIWLQVHYLPGFNGDLNNWV